MASSENKLETVRLKKEIPADKWPHLSFQHGRFCIVEGGIVVEVVTTKGYLVSTSEPSLIKYFHYLLNEYSNCNDIEAVYNPLSQEIIGFRPLFQSEKDDQQPSKPTLITNQERLCNYGIF